MGPLVAFFLLTADPQLHQFVHKSQFEDAIKRALFLHQTEKFDAFSAEKLATSFIEKGLVSNKIEEVLLSLHAALICEKELDLTKLSFLFSHEIPFMQHMILSHVGKLDIHSGYDIYKKALSSMDLGVRIHACQILAQSGYKEGLAQLESLMYRLPPELRYIFADLFAQIGSKEAHIQLKTLLEDKLWTNRVAALLAVADYRQDGLLNYVKSSLSQTQPAEIEAAAFASGVMQNLEAVPKLEKLMTHCVDEIKLSSALALSRLGINTGKEYIKKQALAKDAFAINLLAELNFETEEIQFLTQFSDPSLKLNTVLVLLKKRHPVGLVEAFDLLNHLPPIIPKHSPGRTLVMFKSERKKETLEYGIAFRKYFASLLFHEMFSYPAEHVDSYLIKLLEQKEWVPIICRGLLDRGDEKALKLLKQISETPGNPYLRTQAHLQLYLHKSSLYSKQKLIDFMKLIGKEEIIRFSSATKQDRRFLELFLEPTPEEKSELFLHCAQVLCGIKDKDVMDTFFNLLEKGHPSNRPLIAAFLLIALR